MGHIKEPNGVDFIIESRTLTKAEEQAISEYIKNYKLKKSRLKNEKRAPKNSPKPA